MNEVTMEQLLAMDDDRVYKMMRAGSIQEALNIALPDDAPRSPVEYAQASQVFHMHIILNQPGVLNSSLPPRIAYQASTPNLIAARMVAFQWVAAALCEVAKGQDYSEAVGCVLGLLETVNLMGTKLCFMGAKYAFGIGTTMLRNRSICDQLSTTLMVGIKIMGTTSPSRIMASNLLWTLNTLALFQMTPKGNMERRSTGILAGQYAKEFDEASGSKFRLASWTSETLARL